jgi:hypothetical protein
MQDSALLKSQLGCLMKHFFGRFFDTEVFATPHADMHLLYVQVLALLVMPGIFKTFMAIDKYALLAHMPPSFRDQVVASDMYYFFVFSMIVIGFATVFEWDALFPDQKDYYNLTSLPINPQIVFFAKLAALSLFVLAIYIAINGIPMFLFPGVILAHSWIKGSAGASIKPFEGIRYIVSHAASFLLSSIFVFTSVTALRTLLLLVVPVRLARIASRGAQLLLIVTLLFCILFSIVPVDRWVKDGNASIYLRPPFWFLGIFEVMIGHHNPIFWTLAKTGFKFTFTVLFLAALFYALSYRSSMQKGFQSGSVSQYDISFVGSAWNWIMHKTLLRGFTERASFHFIAQTAFRRQEHLLYWGSFVSVGIVIIYFVFFKNDNGGYVGLLWAAPLILSFFILVGFRYAFSVPADLNANWIFKIIDRRKLPEAFEGTHKFMLCAIYFPLLFIFAPCYFLLWDVWLAVSHILYVAIVSMILSELLLLRFEKLPFTCSYIPGKANIKLKWPLYLICFFLYCFGGMGLGLWLLKGSTRYVVFLLIAGFVLFLLRRSRALFLKRSGAIQFEEEPPDKLILLSDCDL